MVIRAKVPCLLFDSPEPVIRQTLHAEIDAGLLDQIKADPSFATQRLKEYLAYLRYELADGRTEKLVDIQSVATTLSLLYLATLKTDDTSLKRFVADGTCFLRGLYLKTAMNHVEESTAVQGKDQSASSSTVDIVYTNSGLAQECVSGQELCHG